MAGFDLVLVVHYVAGFSEEQKQKGLLAWVGVADSVEALQQEEVVGSDLVHEVHYAAGFSEEQKLKECVFLVNVYKN